MTAEIRQIRWVQALAQEVGADRNSSLSGQSRAHFAAFMYGLKPAPFTAEARVFTKESLSVASKTHVGLLAFAARLKSCPFKTSTYSGGYLEKVQNQAT
jgi:hypothetical protein